MIHFYSEFNSPDPDEARRNAAAKLSWLNQGWLELPIPDSRLSRFFIDGQRRLPYIKDLFDLAAQDEPDGEIIVFTNTDLWVSTDCSRRIKSRLQWLDACYSFRREFYRRLDDCIPDSEIATGEETGGTDLYAMRAGWWRARRHEFPDLLLGRNFWDSCMNQLIRESYGNEGLAELPAMTYHEHHQAFCGLSENRFTIPSQMYVWNLAKEWLRSRGVSPFRDYKIPNEWPIKTLT